MHRQELLMLQHNKQEYVYRDFVKAQIEILILTVFLIIIFHNLFFLVHSTPADIEGLCDMQ